jgi:hypothetical protein
MVVVETIIRTLLGVAKGVRILHGAAMHVPVAGHVGFVVAGGKGTVARARLGSPMPLILLKK